MRRSIILSGLLGAALVAGVAASASATSLPQVAATDCGGPDITLGTKECMQAEERRLLPGAALVADQAGTEIVASHRVMATHGLGGPTAISAEILTGSIRR